MNRRDLAPLAPDAYLRWLWVNHRERITLRGYTGFLAPSLSDLQWDMRDGHPESVLRRELVSEAARVRRNQRLGKGPWDPHQRTANPRWLANLRRRLCGSEA